MSREGTNRHGCLALVCSLCDSHAPKCFAHIICRESPHGLTHVFMCAYVQMPLESFRRRQSFLNKNTSVAARRSSTGKCWCCWCLPFFSDILHIFTAYTSVPLFGYGGNQATAYLHPHTHTDTHTHTHTKHTKHAHLTCSLLLSPSLSFSAPGPFIAPLFPAFLCWRQGCDGAAAPVCASQHSCLRPLLWCKAQCLQDLHAPAAAGARCWVSPSRYATELQCQVFPTPRRGTELQAVDLCKIMLKAGKCQQRQRLPVHVRKGERAFNSYHLFTESSFGKSCIPGCTSYATRGVDGSDAAAEGRQEAAAEDDAAVRDPHHLMQQESTGSKSAVLLEDGTPQPLTGETTSIAATLSAAPSPLRPLQGFCHMSTTSLASRSTMDWSGQDCAASSPFVP
eukprot:1158503-Pelagomonas_calceolata.AAC.8